MSGLFAFSLGGGQLCNSLTNGTNAEFRLGIVEMKRRRSA